MIEYYVGYNGDLKVRHAKPLRKCGCRTVTHYIDDVPYDREILCEQCAGYELRLEGDA